MSEDETDHHSDGKSNQKVIDCKQKHKQEVAKLGKDILDIPVSSILEARNKVLTIRE